MVERLNVRFHVYKILAMGDQARGFKHVTKALRSALPPIVIGLVLECAVKSGVDFDCGKLMGIKLKPLLLWQVFRVKATPPVVVCPT